MQSNQNFEMPYVESGETVHISTYPDGQDPVIGTVIDVRPRTIAALVIGPGGISIFRDCWHMDDPKCHTHEDVIKDDTERGVWKLSPLTEKNRLLFATVKDLQREVRTLRQWVDVAEERRRGNKKGARRQEPVPA